MARKNANKLSLSRLKSLLKKFHKDFKVIRDIDDPSDCASDVLYEHFLPDDEDAKPKSVDPAAIRWLVFNDDEQCMFRAYALEHRHCPVDVLRQVWKSPPKYFADDTGYYIASNPRCPDDLLNEIVQKKTSSASALGAVADHPNASVATLKAIITRKKQFKSATALAKSILLKRLTGLM